MSLNTMRIFNILSSYVTQVTVYGSNDIINEVDILYIGGSEILLSGQKNIEYFINTELELNRYENHQILCSVIDFARNLNKLIVNDMKSDERLPLGLDISCYHISSPKEFDVTVNGNYLEPTLDF